MSTRFKITEHRDPMSWNQGAPWYVTSDTPDPDGDTTWGHFPTREQAEAFIDAVHEKESAMTKPTITVPRTDYVQRADDEGRDYLALRTIRAAAIQWAAVDGRSWTDHGPTGAPLLIFVTSGTTPNVFTVDPDESMEDLYPAEDLPFTIRPARAEAGDWVSVADGLPRPRRITNVRDDGTWELDLDGQVGLIPIPDQEIWTVVPAPTVTYSVTVRADHSADAIQGAIQGVLTGDVEVRKP